MGIKQDLEESLKDYFITKIDGQPSKEAISKLKLELSEGLASILNHNGGGWHGHIGLIIPTTEYTTFSHNNNTPYDILDNPGPYPMTVDLDDLVRERQIAEQRSYPQHRWNHKSSHVIRHRSRDGSALHQRTQGSRGAKHFRGTGPQTTAHAHSNRQLHGRGHRQQSCPAKTHKSHGHNAVPLAARPCKSKTIPILLAPRHDEQGDYFTKHNPVSHHRNMRPELLTPHKVLMALWEMQNMSGGRATGTTARVC